MNELTIITRTTTATETTIKVNGTKVSINSQKEADPESVRQLVEIAKQLGIRLANDVS
ncbi:MAG: hypothetical protein II897_04070 [Clostridia bacterium]|nr:hypothetical protein [Clostridia bacterium]